MFGFFKRKQPPLACGLDGETWVAMFDEANSPEELEYVRISEHVCDLLDTLQVDIKRQRIIWTDGTALSIAGLCERIRKAEPSMALETIDESVVNWLEQAWCPEDVPEKQMERLQHKIENWIEVHQGKQESALS